MARVTMTAGRGSRRVAGVQFVDGVAETDDPGALAYFRRRPGYEVEAAPRRRKPAARKPKHQAPADEAPADTGERDSSGLDEFRPDNDGGDE